MRRKLWLIAILLLLFPPGLAAAQEEETPAPPLPPLELYAHDFRNDQGHKTTIVWLPSLDDPVPTLPTEPLSMMPSGGELSEKELLELEIDRDRYSWWAFLEPSAEAPADPAIAEVLSEYQPTGNLGADRAAFRTIYSRIREQKRIRELQEQAIKKLKEEDPSLAAKLDEKRAKLAKYLVQRADSPDGPWRVVGVKGPGSTAAEDSGASRDQPLETGREYFYRVVVIGTDGSRSTSNTVSTKPRAQWWYFGRTNNFYWTGIFIALVVGWIWGAGKILPGGGVIAFLVFFGVLGIFAWIGYGTPGNPATLGFWVAPLVAVGVAQIGRRARELYIRPIAGIEAVEEAIGRATEMGKPILYVPGLSTIEDIATLASLNILGPVAEKAAEYDSKIIVPNRDPVVYTIAQEIVKESYLRAGRPDSFDPANIYFVTGRQFAYAAAVNGLMLREKPATNFFLGMFWAESLLLAETGSMTGAIQIAGTDAVTQLPFFIVACDYTLIGEELYAAGAYMGRDPKLLGGLKGQDYNKALALISLAVWPVVFFALDIFRVRSGLTDLLREVFKTLYKVQN